MNYIRYYFIVVLSLLIATNAYSEENPDLDPSSSGGSVFVKSPRSDVDKFLKSKNMKRGRNTKKDGTPYFIFVGDGEISASRDNKMIHDARYAAFSEAFIEAKTEYVKSLGLKATRPSCICPAILADVASSIFPGNIDLKDSSSETHSTPP